MTDENKAAEQVISPASIDGAEEFGTPELQGRAYLASHHLWAARHFARLARERDALPGRPAFDVCLRAYIVSTFTESVAFLEAMIRELLRDAHDAERGEPGTRSTPLRFREEWGKLWSSAKGSSDALRKYQEALTAAGLDQFDEQKAPYRPAILLRLIRNKLAHFTPETVNISGAPTPIVPLREELERSYTCDGDGNCFFPDFCLSVDGARWAVDSALALADEFCSRVNIRANYHEARWPDP